MTELGINMSESEPEDSASGRATQARESTSALMTGSHDGNGPGRRDMLSAINRKMRTTLCSAARARGASWRPTVFSSGPGCLVISGVIVMAANAGARASAESILAHPTMPAFMFPGSKVFLRPLPGHRIGAQGTCLFQQRFRQFSSADFDGEEKRSKSGGKNYLRALTKLNALKRENPAAEGNKHAQPKQEVPEGARLSKNEQELEAFFSEEGSEDPLETLMQVPPNEVRFKELLQEEEPEYKHNGPKRLLPSHS
jgi:hypothetical protein